MGWTGDGEIGDGMSEIGSEVWEQKATGDTGSILLAKEQRPSWDRCKTPDGWHRLIHGDALNLHRLGAGVGFDIGAGTDGASEAPAVEFASYFDLAFLDIPALGDVATFTDLKRFSYELFSMLDVVMGPNSAICILARERKGPPILKGPITATTAMAHGWACWRHMLWRWASADFNRSAYCYHDLYLMRRGSLGANPKAAWRYKDVLDDPRVSLVNRTDKLVDEVNPSLVLEFARLFGGKGSHLLDPFSGSGIARTALAQRGIETTSLELYPSRYEHLRDTVYAS